MNNTQKAYLLEKILLAADGALSPDEFATLQDQLKADPEAVDWYVDVTTTLAALTSASLVQGQLNKENTGQLISTLIEHEAEGPLASDSPAGLQLSDSLFDKTFTDVIEADLYEKKRQDELLKTSQKVHDGRSPSWVTPPRRRLYVFTHRDVLQSLVRLAAVVVFALSIVWLDSLVWRGQRPKVRVGVVSALRGELATQGRHRQAETDEILYVGEYTLADESLAEITVTNGVRAVLEGPAVFEWISPRELYLKEGKVFAHVPPQAVGFTVSCPSSRIIDLGTELGVEVRADGSSSVYTYDGSVSFINLKDDRALGNEILTAGTARSADGNTGHKQQIVFEEAYFARTFSAEQKFVWRGHTTLDLGDIVCGGNGFGTGDRGLLIDPFSGRMVKLANAERERQYVLGTNTYRPVRESRYIDGIFIPYGESPLERISSAGHTFDSCPQTNLRFNKYFGNISYQTIEHLRSLGKPSATDHLKYVHTAEQSVIYMHANLGITFDLEKLRDDMTPLQMTSFEATCLNYGDPAAVPKTQDCNADFFVLVDGEVRFNAPGITSSQSALVSVPLTEKDRFLTLVVTMGDDVYEHVFDRTLFLNPRLTLSGSR